MKVPESYAEFLALPDAEREELVKSMIARSGPKPSPDPHVVDRSQQPLVRCPTCSREWPAGCEQAVAIRKRGECIVCLIAHGEKWCKDPYEFDSEADYSPNPTGHAPARSAAEGR